MSAHLTQRLREAEESLAREIRLASVEDSWKENVNYLTAVTEDAVRIVGTHEASQRSIETDYMNGERCALKELQATDCYSAPRPREVHASPGKHPLQVSDTVSNGSADQAMQELKVGLEGKLRFFHEVLRNLLWTEQHGIDTAAESQGASSAKVKTLKEQVGKLDVAVYGDLIEAHYRKQVVSAHSQHRALTAVLHKLEEQNSRLVCLEALQRYHRETVEQLLSIMTGAHEVLNSAKEKYILMLSHLKEAKTKAAATPVLRCNWRWEDNGAELEENLKRFQKDLLRLADAVEAEDADETSRRMSLTKALENVRKGRKEEMSRAVPFLEQAKALQQVRKKRVEKFKSRAFTYFYLHPEEFEKKAAQFSSK